MTNSWMNEDGEPIMDGAAWRFEQQLDSDSAEDRARMAYDDDYYADYEDEGHVYDDDDLSPNGAPWCYGCDDYAKCGEWEPDGAPCCPDPGCGRNPCTFPGYAANH